MAERVAFWPYYPERWLLSDKVRNMPLVAVAGYRFLCDHAMLSDPPGILPMDDEKLREWSRLNVREWKRYKRAILANFELLTRNEGSAVSEWLGQHFIMSLYRAYERKCCEYRQRGLLGANARWRKSGDTTPKMPTHADAYIPYAKKKERKESTTTPAPLGGGAGVVVPAQRISPPPPLTDKRSVNPCPTLTPKLADLTTEDAAFIESLKRRTPPPLLQPTSSPSAP